MEYKGIIGPPWDVSTPVGFSSHHHLTSRICCPTTEQASTVKASSLFEIENKKRRNEKS